MKEKLKLELNTISRIILLANSSFEVVKYFETENKKDTPIIIFEKNLNIFFNYVSVNFYRVTIIELCKLFNHRETYSLKKLLNKFNTEQEFYGLIDEINLREYKRELNQNKGIVNELIELRNKHYAHQDEDFKNYIDMETTKIQALLDDAKSFYNKIYVEVYQKTYNFDFPLGTPMDSLNFIMHRIEFHDNYFKDLEKNI